MKITLTNEEKEAIELYKNGEYKVINQLLVSDSNSDIALLREDVENESVKINYDRETLIRDLKAIKIIYELLQKVKLKRNQNEDWAFTRGTNVIEIERFQKETFIDKCLDATVSKELAENKYALLWNEPAVMYIKGSKNIPYINFNELENLNIENDKDILISPFTKVKSITNNNDIKVDNKFIKTYNISLEKQELQGMPKDEKQNLYINILGNSDYINIKLNEVIRLEKESNNVYENIRKIEQLTAKTEQELDKKRVLENYSEYEINLDEENLNRLKKEVVSLKDQVKNIYERIKECTEFITKWKKSVTIYIMSECYDIDVKYKDMSSQNTSNIEIEYNDSEDDKNNEVQNENNEIVEDLSKSIKKDMNIDFNQTFDIDDDNLSILNNVQENELNNIEVNQEKQNSLLSEEQKEELENKMKQVNEICKENSDTVEKIAKYIEYLLYKQQSFAKIAGKIGGNYSALNNCFEMRKQIEDLKELVDKIHERADYLYNFEKENAIKKLDKLNEVSLQVSTLLNYLNNPKSSVGRTRINRFEEMAIIEENELKRNIADLLLEIRGEAELKKLKDDLAIIEDKNPLQRLLGIFTGRNKLDEVMIEQIIIRQDAINRTLSRELRLDYNYSIHELVAETEMFIRENDDDELVEDTVKRLQNIENELKQEFVILDEKVRDIINQREGRNLPIDEKITRGELIEIETYRFLKKYKYDEKEDKTPEIEYQDTMANEIFTIIDYIRSSKVLAL